MFERNYYGHSTQFFGVEEHRLIGGRGDGMRLLQVRNGSGVEFTVSADRCADISRLSYRGVNLNYMSVGGYAGPSYYDDKGDNWLKTFNCGFLTTCGLANIGIPQNDQGEELPLHGTIGNQPADHIWYTSDQELIEIHAHVPDMQIFGRKMELERTISCPVGGSTMTIRDRVRNTGSKTEPLLILYHMNMGYPLLSEKSVVRINSSKVTPRNEHAAENLDTWDKMIPPTAGFEEQCYYHEFEPGRASARIFNPDAGAGLAISFDPSALPYLTEWKMMGEKDYVLGLEPMIATLDGRRGLRESGKLPFIGPDEEREFEIRVEFFDSMEKFDSVR
ncbi:MAG: aldose 1-epimerase family protein [Lachnospiraceae bacterium]|nr:aldose 1-epimerase family protein [Lachnospiraceae bacterium]